MSAAVAKCANCGHVDYHERGKRSPFFRPGCSHHDCNCERFVAPGRAAAWDVVKLTANGAQLLAELDRNAKRRLESVGKSTGQLGRSARERRRPGIRKAAA